jgi:hypothetical protein
MMPRTRAHTPHAHTRMHKHTNTDTRKHTTHAPAGAPAYTHRHTRPHTHALTAAAPRRRAAGVALAHGGDGTGPRRDGTGPRRGGTGPRRGWHWPAAGWHWPAAGMALARGGVALARGQAAMESLAEADVVIALGCRMNPFGTLPQCVVAAIRTLIPESRTRYS